ncbi:MAG TPA: sigma-54 dependent transcriptional regulator [Gemmatimonadaceae bacterium]|nr:sigma-54 dependent transcriptional regulator [Gemmatimonadaceae bacterium]
MPNLSLLSLTDSLAAMWQPLAADCGLSLVTLGEAAAFDRQTNAVGVVAAAGAEEQLEPTFAQIVGGGIEIAAVGTVPSHRLAVSVVRAGAAQYFALPDDLELLRSWLAERGERLLARQRRHAFVAGEGSKYRFDGILGESPALRAALDRAGRVIPHANVTVLVTGETGTGKELLARAIHYNGPRRDAPFVDINCAAIPPQLLESELFGHEKGAFTDATSAKPGLFELANGGTIFLDEIGHLALPLQGKLLRALEERQIRRVGGSRAIPIDVRIVAATHVDLAAAARRGEFREDLYFRLNVVPVELPPLRARRADILPLARHFLARFADEYGLPVPALTAAAEHTLLDRGWPGNVRELRNIIERALLLGGDVLDAADLSDEQRPGPAAPSGVPFPATLGDIARGAARAMLDLTGGNKSEAARRLGISRPRLQRLLDGAPDLDSDSDTDSATESSHA